MEKNNSPSFESANYQRRKHQNVKSLDEDVLETLASPGFKQWTIKSAKSDAATGDGMVIFIGSGDISSNITCKIKENNKHIVIVVLDSKISVGCSDADYFLWLKDEQGLLNDRAVINILVGLAPKKSEIFTQSLRTWFARSSNRFASLHSKPLLIGEYHGFHVKQVFEAAERLGYQVLPDKHAAIVAMNKAEFRNTYLDHPIWSRHVLSKELLDGETGFGSEEFIQEAKKKILSIGLPCMLKPAISEFGYGLVKLADVTDIKTAFKAVAEQCSKYNVNPGNQIVIEPFVQRIVIERLSKDKPIDLLQVIVRYKNRLGQLEATCLPPIWFSHYPLRSYEMDNLTAGPCVLDFAIQAPASELPEVFSSISYEEICKSSMAFVESMTQAPGLYGLEIFIQPDGSFWYNELNVRTEDTMFATIATQQIDAFSLLAQLIQNEEINSESLKQKYVGGIKTIVWQGNTTGEIEDIKGVEEAMRLPYIKNIVIYREKWDELRPYRRYGLITVQAPPDTSIDDVVATLNKADALLTIVPKN